MTTIEGRLVRGLGQAASFTQMEWVRTAFIESAGIDPHPGTVNIELGEDDHQRRWLGWRASPGETIAPADARFCAARCYPVRVAERIPAAIVVPEVADYPENKVELVAALPLRSHLTLDEGSAVRVGLCRPLVARAVLFDIDGTMVDSVGAFLEVARVAGRPHGIDVTHEQVRESLVSGSNFWRTMVPDDHPDGERLRKSMSATAVEAWPRVLREHGRVFEGLAGTLDELRAKGMVLGIVSGARAEVLELLREQQILERFDAVILGTDVARRKPDPEGIVTCLRRLGVAPDSAVYVGDTPIDIEAARAAGVRSVGVLTGAGDSAMLSASEADRLVASHARLSRVIDPA